MEVLTGIITDAEVVTSTEVVIDSKLPDTEVEVSKSITAEVSPDNYVLSSGGMYGAGFTGDAPTWLLDAVQQELSTGTGNVMSVLQGMQTVLDSLTLGVNQNIAQIQSTILSQASLATSVQSQIDANEASILNVVATRVTPTEASAIALQVQQSTFGTDASAFIGNIASTYVSPTSAIAQDVSLIATELNDISASISEVSLLTTEVVLNPLWVNDGFNTDPDALGHPKYITRAIAKKQLQVDANGVITGYIAESGATSNFTINADNFSVRATGQTVASQNPFTVNATTGKSTFNGVVDFTSTNAVGTTTIDGGKITTGSITAGQIAANTISTNQLAVGTGIVNGYVQSSDFTTVGGAGFRLKSNAAGTAVDPTIYGAYIYGSTIHASNFSIASTYISNPNNPSNQGRFYMSSFSSINSEAISFIGINSSPSGYVSNRCVADTQRFMMDATAFSGNGVSGSVSLSIDIQVSIDGGAYSSIRSTSTSYQGVYGITGSLKLGAYYEIAGSAFTTIAFRSVVGGNLTGDNRVGFSVVTTNSI